MKAIPKREDYSNDIFGTHDWMRGIKQWAKEAEKIILEYEKEASIRAVIDAESLGGIEQQEGKA